VADDEALDLPTRHGQLPFQTAAICRQSWFRFLKIPG